MFGTSGIRSHVVLLGQPKYLILLLFVVFAEVGFLSRQKGVTQAFDEEFSSVRSTVLSLKFLDRLQQMPGVNMNEKYFQVLRQFRHELDEIRLLFKKQKQDPPASRNFSPMAGNSHLVVNISVTASVSVRRTIG